jgi:hypothetical protein
MTLMLPFIPLLLRIPPRSAPWPLPLPALNTKELPSESNDSTQFELLNLGYQYRTANEGGQIKSRRAGDREGTSSIVGSLTGVVS